MSYFVKSFRRRVGGDLIRMIQFLWFAQVKEQLMYVGYWCRKVVCNARRKATDCAKLTRLILFGQASACITTGEFLTPQPSLAPYGVPHEVSYGNLGWKLSVSLTKDVFLHEQDATPYLLATSVGA